MKGMYYENSKGVRLDLLCAPYRLQTAEFFDYRWEYGSISTKRNGGKITGFSKVTSSKMATLGIMGGSTVDYYSALDHFFESVEYDVLNLSPGKLWIGNQYLLCYIISSEKTDWESGIEVLDNEIEILTDYPFWCRDKLYHFYASTGQIVGGGYRYGIPNLSQISGPSQDYPRDYKYGYITHYKPAIRRFIRDYPYGYHRNHTVGRLDNDHFAESSFQMIVYGPCIRPEIRIGDNLYQVNTTLYDSEYMVVDSRERTVVKYAINGVVENLFNKRGKEHYLFQKIHPGKNTVRWNAQYPFDVIIYQERSEPAWSM